MIDLLPLFMKTKAYNVIKGDKEKGFLSHAYLVISQDKTFLPSYLKILAKVICCKEGVPCGNCRTCRLIEQEIYPDVYTYPKEKDAMLKVDDVADLIDKTIYKPIESDKKVFIINNGDSMSELMQNKLLKTLEEPPKNCYFLFGATSEYPLLSTIKSRMKKVEVDLFSKEDIFDALKGDLRDGDKLLTAISCGDGTVGKAYLFYGDKSLNDINGFIEEMLVDMKTSKDVLDFSTKFNGLKISVEQLLNVFELVLRDLLMIECGKNQLTFNGKLASVMEKTSGFNKGAILYILDKVTEAKMRLKRTNNSVNSQMLIEWLLFAILEGKYKWQQL